MDELPAAFGKYFLIEKIATGGMAELFLAKLIGPGGFEKALIIKQIHPALTGQRRFVDLFVAEAKTLVSLSHGNVVPVYELGVVDDVYFIAMEYIDGPTLRGLMDGLGRRGARMTPAIAAYIAAEVLQGLAYAHRKGVIHRDLSPRNVMVSRDGEVKLVDFGIAVREDEAPAQGVLAGSYPYMSPEQVRGEELTPQSDLFSAGVLLWEMLTGRELFARPGADDTLRAVTDAAVVPPSALVPEVPPELDAACARALCRDRAGRHADASAFLAEVHRYLYGLAEPVTAATLAELVARTCPPEVRGGAGGGERVEAGGGTRPLPGRTAVAQGERRASTVRTFATHVHFREVLARATPLLPIPAITGSEVPAASGAALGEVPATSGRAQVPVTSRWPDRMRRALLAILLVAASVLVAFGLRVPGTTDRSLPIVMTPAHFPVDTSLAAAWDAAPDAPADAAPADAAPVDAMPRSPRPVRARPRSDGPGSAVERRTGLLKVGANPWGEVYLDGAKLGRAPNAWTVTAGVHTVEVVFPVEGREQRRSFEITVAPDQTTSLGIVDFTARP